MHRSRSILLLLLLVVADVWYRAHTFGQDARAVLGINAWPTSAGESEPLDCDEAAYAYIGHRILNGDVMYRDLTENKPPLGYWLYTLAVAIGGYNELAIRVMPIPFVVCTIALVWWIGGRLAGPAAAGLAAFLFMILSTDPYLFGNGANMEHFINFFSVAGLALFLRGWDGAGRTSLVASGACVAAAVLIKQVAIMPAVVMIGALWIGRRADDGRARRDWTERAGDIAWFALGLAVALCAAAAVVIATGGGRAAFEDIFQYGRALATDTLPEPGAPAGAVRWLTGNADPEGRLPWPFGTTDYLVWWGGGTWPLWLVSAPALLWMAVGWRATGPRRLVVAWTAAAWAQVILPGLYWPHYYLLPIAGVALAVAVALADAMGAVFSPKTTAGRRVSWRAAASVLVLVAATAGAVWIQGHDYLRVKPTELTVRYKGGAQWVALRSIGRELRARADRLASPRIYVWGWQSPLHFYGRLDSPTRHFFVDNLLRDQAERNHPLIAPRIDEIMRALERDPPALVFTGYRPFRALQGFLNAHYFRSRMSLGLWVKRDDFGRFETASPR